MITFIHIHKDAGVDMYKVGYYTKPIFTTYSIYKLEPEEKESSLRKIHWDFFFNMRILWTCFLKYSGQMLVGLLVEIRLLEEKITVE